MPDLTRTRESEAVGWQQLVRSMVLARAAAAGAGMAARDGARSAATWAAPRVSGARTWTASRIEWSGVAIKDTVAPKIHESLLATARFVDASAPPEAPRRRWPQVIAGTALLAAAGAAAAIVLRRRNAGGQVPAEAAEPATSTQPAHDGQPQTSNGSPGAPADASGQSPAT
ncbi:MAG TPA: hypothetical protein VIK57_18615 [Streptosporangiaceae bacterium]